MVERSGTRWCDRHAERGDEIRFHATATYASGGTSPVRGRSYAGFRATAWPVLQKPLLPTGAAATFEDDGAASA